MKNTIVLIIGCLIITLLSSCSKKSQKLTNPTKQNSAFSFQTSTPDKQGMNSEMLYNLIKAVSSKYFFINLGDSNGEIDSILVIRNGYIVLDSYFYPYSPEIKHHVFSCTKSVISLLVGIAIDKGYIKNVNQKIISFFPDKTFQNMTNDKKQITIKNLLTMTNGLASYDSYIYDWQGLNKIYNQKDWISFILNLPLSYKPGTHFEYSNLSTFLLSAILQKATGMPTQEFAKKYLFQPLEIKNYSCDLNPNGTFYGYCGLNITPHELAKIGLLCLNHGKWQGKRIISKSWLEESTKNYLHNYGYQWWINEQNIKGLYRAMGMGGQMLLIDEANKTVVVFTSKLQDSDLPYFLFNTFISPAIKSDKPIKPNLEYYNKLLALEKKIQQPPTPKPIPSMPKIATEISGNTYQVTNNSTGETLEWTFNFTKNSASITQKFRNDTVYAQIGLNGLYKTTTEDNGEKILASGSWITDDTFYFKSYTLYNFGTGNITVTFQGKNKLFGYYDSFPISGYVIKKLKTK